MIGLAEQAFFLGETVGTIVIYAIAVLCAVGAVLDWVGDYRKNKKRGKNK